MDHYTANGWRVGKNPMRDWKAAVRTWEKNGVRPSVATGSAKTAATAEGLREFIINGTSGAQSDA